MKYNLTQIAQQLENELRERLDKSGLMFRLFSRVKTQRSIIHKMGIKGEAYRNGTLLMQDIIGFRVVLYFQDDIDIVALFLSSNGLVRKSIDEPDSSTFRPQRLNLTLSIPESLVDDFRHELPEEFAPYIGSTYEVQIRTIFSEGWHEVEHDLRYKCKEDWKDCEPYSRTLNGLIATLETAEWTMKSLFHEMATKNYLFGNYRAMLRNKMRLRLTNDDFSPAVTEFLQQHPDIAEAVLKTDRMIFVFTLLHHRQHLPLTFDHVLFLMNRIEFLHPELKMLETPETRQIMDEFLAS